LLVANQLSEVEFFEFPLLGQGFVALRVEFYADAVRALLLDDLSNQIGGFARNVCGTNDDELTVADLDDVNVAAVIALAGTRGLVGDDRPRYR